ncbi:MAG: helix-turn-helix transcriptional regulator [Clostridia bacterium]|nr:helix-turn-helix transcriptional regulator [Clostridia bacterium]
MTLNLGEKIRGLRKRDKRTQEALAEALGVTCQAVSRWEAGYSYPDMELIPSIANYFGITIDELFGYENDREEKISAIIEKINSFNIRSRSDDDWVDECVSILREGLIEFPQNERLLIVLAETLWESGWRRQEEWLSYDKNGFIQYSYDREHKNKYWIESGKICEQIINNTKDNSIFTRAIAILVPLYRNFGKYDVAISYANQMPPIQKCREYLLTEGTDGKLSAKYIGDFLLKSAREFSEQLIFSLVSNKRNYESDMPIEKVKGAIAIFALICDDGNMGEYHDFVSKLYLYLSRLEWERGYHNDAFASLDKALEHARSMERLSDGKEHTLTAPLVSYVTFKLDKGMNCASLLPENWPFWCNPDYSQVEKEIKADPRWDEWVKKTQSSSV